MMGRVYCGAGSKGHGCGATEMDERVWEDESMVL